MFRLECELFKGSVSNEQVICEQVGVVIGELARLRLRPKFTFTYVSYKNVKGFKAPSIKTEKRLTVSF